MLVTKDVKIIYQNEIGGEVELSLFSSYVLGSFNEEVKNHITTSKTSLIHGENYISNTLESRYITISGVIEKNSNTELLRLQLIKVFNPTLKGKLIYSNKEVVKEIQVMPQEVPDVRANQGLFIFNIELVANNPFWKDKEKTEYLAFLVPCLKFPVVIPRNKGMVFGVKRSVLETEIQNVGDVESGFRVVFKARSGTVSFPKIYNKLTGDYIKINYEMEKGDTIEVINYPEIKKITINGLTNGFLHLDIDSEFFNLVVGKNIIGYHADKNTMNLDIIVYYTPRFLGV